MSNRAFLGIGELGRRTGLATSALRYYERVGLLVPDGRANGRRYYGPTSAERIGLIRLCQDAGSRSQRSVYLSRLEVANILHGGD
jgi:hypothetical protein